MKKGYTENGQNETGNTIYNSDATGKDLVFVGNDGYESADWGKFVIQGFSSGQWNEIENGICDTEQEAADCVNDLINDGIYDAENIRYEQI